MDGALVARARVFVDSREAALQEAGDLVIPIREGRFGPDHLAAELGDVAAGRAPGRTSPSQVTVFKSLGLAVEDVAAAASSTGGRASAGWEGGDYLRRV